MVILVTLIVIQSTAICALSGLLNLTSASIRFFKAAGARETLSWLSYLIHIRAHAHNQTVFTHGADELRKLCKNTLG
jgi:hypothetical protein